MVKNIAIGTGRRKTAVARVFVRDGSGKIVVNGKDVKEYFATAEQIQVVQQPLLVTSMGSKYDILINVQGGGMNGQAAACLHGISRALVQIDPDARVRSTDRRVLVAASSSQNVSIYTSFSKSYRKHGHLAVFFFCLCHCPA